MQSLLSGVVTLLVVVTCSVYSKETAHDNGLLSSDDASSATDHQAHKRMAFSSPTEEEDGLLLAGDGVVGASAPEDYLDKRGSLFRFGKRQGSLFRFGKKRGSLFRFGKRQGGTLFRFGKRGGTLFRFGRSGAANFPLEGSEEDQRASFRFDRGSDLDLLRSVLAQYELENSPSYLEGAESKRGVDSFHWGSEAE